MQTRAWVVELLLVPKEGTLVFIGLPSCACPDVRCRRERDTARRRPSQGRRGREREKETEMVTKTQRNKNEGYWMMTADNGKDRLRQRERNEQKRTVRERRRGT